jgi:hypothetical protein
MGDNNLTNEDLNNVHVLDTNFWSIPSEENQAKLTPGGTIKFMAPEETKRFNKYLTTEPRKEEINHMKAQNALWNLESNTKFMKKLKSKNSKAWNLYRNTVKKARAAMSTKAEILNPIMMKGCKTVKIAGKLTQLTPTSYRIIFA